jgi:NAD(P)-dependent dehydrogenase (short-subunit alcohol dehydrogenase family)
VGKLDGKVAVITGGASGIGAAAVRLFVEEGCRVLIVDVQDDKGARLADELGKSSAYFHADVSRESDVSGAIAHALSRFGRLDCLYNNAGLGGVSGSIAEIRWTATTRRWACSCAGSSSA